MGVVRLTVDWLHTTYSEKAIHINSQFLAFVVVIYEVECHDKYSALLPDILKQIIIHYYFFGSCEFFIILIAIYIYF